MSSSNGFRFSNGPPLSKDEISLYRKHVAEQMYMDNTFRPDLPRMHAAGYLARHLQVPSHSHSTLLGQTLAYLKATKG
jgi:hypothetical protein